MTTISDTTVYSRASNIATAVLGAVLIVLGLIQLGADPWPHWKLSEPLSLINIVVGVLFVAISGFRLWRARRRGLPAVPPTRTGVPDAAPVEQGAQADAVGAARE